MADFLDTFSLAFSHSPILAWSSIVTGAALVRCALAPSKDWLFIAACAAPYGAVALLAMR